MKLRHAYLCISCEEINDCAPHGVCQACGSEAVYPLSKALSPRALSISNVWNVVSQASDGTKRSGGTLGTAR